MFCKNYRFIDTERTRVTNLSNEDYESSFYFFAELGAVEFNFHLLHLMSLSIGVKIEVSSLVVKNSVLLLKI